MHALKGVAKSLQIQNRLLRERLQRRLTTRRLYGPAHISLTDDQVMVVTLMRNAKWFLDVFIEHHLRMGATHILIIDNGSEEDFLETVRPYGERITVLQNSLPAKRHESALRSNLAKRVATGGWLLFADADELTELAAPVEKLLHYCNTQNYTAVLGQMLDRFSDLPYGELRKLDYRSAIEAMEFYSLSQVESIDYDDRAAVPFHWFMRDNFCDEPTGRLKRGGLRKEIFGEAPFLSKHSLVRNTLGVVPMSHPHCASGVRVADVSLVLNHYKLAGDWVARDRKTVEAALWEHGDDARRLTLLDKNSDFRFMVEKPRSWLGLEPLRKEGFLHMSNRFRCTLHLPDIERAS